MSCSQIFVIKAEYDASADAVLPFWGNTELRC